MNARAKGILGARSIRREILAGVIEKSYFRHRTRPEVSAAAAFRLLAEFPVCARDFNFPRARAYIINIYPRARFIFLCLPSANARLSPRHFSNSFLSGMPSPRIKGARVFREH